MSLTNPPHETQSRCCDWHRETWRHLQQARDAERLPHALLLEGEPGTGRNDLALALARQILCHAPVADGNCGECKACVLSRSGAHGDACVVQPETPGKAIGVDAIRDAMRFANGTSTLGKYKVLLVSPVEALTVSAFNAFLKGLEEPAQDSFIVLVGSRGRALPATIRSRCQRLQLPSPTAGDALQWLRAQAVLENTRDEELREALGLAAQRPLHALALLETGAIEALTRFDAALLLPAQREAEQLTAAEALDADTFLDTLERRVQHWLREQPAGVLRALPGRQAFEALSVIERFRRARRSGSNPNDDLLRFSVLRAWHRLWEPSRDNDRLPQTFAGNRPS